MKPQKIVLHLFHFIHRVRGMAIGYLEVGYPEVKELKSTGLGVRPRSVLLGTISSPIRDSLPYAAGCLISYAHRNPAVRESFVFLEPEWRSHCLVSQDFHDKLEQADFLGLTCYIWNQVINDSIVEVFKKKKPGGVVIYGGPNVPEDPEELESYACSRPLVDHFITGPGEKDFVELLISREPKRFYHGTQIGPQAVPTPYTDKIFDSILEKSGPIDGPIETNRGCPYGCAYCDWGGQSRNKIQQFDEDRVRGNIRNALEKKHLAVLYILDANFGILKRDLDYMKFIVEEKKRLNKKIHLMLAGMAKNGSRYLSEIINLILENFDNNGRNVKLSFQTMNESVLANVNRKNMTSQRLMSITEGLNSITLNSELLIGLPGETPDSYLKTLCQQIDLSIDLARSHSLQILPNTPMNQREYRSRFQIKSKKVLTPHDLSRHKQSEILDERGQFLDIKTETDPMEKLKWEISEVIYSCSSYGPHELVRMYDFWFWYNTFYNARVAREEIERSSHRPEEQAYRFFDNLEKMPFLRGLVQQHREIVWATIAKPEEETFLCDLKSANWFHKGMCRGSELVEICFNRDIVERELRQLYPDFNTDHFVVRKNKEINLLLSSFARI